MSAILRVSASLRRPLSQPRDARTGNLQRHARIAAYAVAAAMLLTLGVAAAPAAAQAAEKPSREQEGNQRPRIVVRARPEVAITPARIVLTAELAGGANDFEDYYCPTVEWDWGDDTRSESTIDCGPYEAGKSEIRRRFTIEHTYKRSGAYKVYFRMKKRDRIVGSGSVNVTVRPGARDYN